MPQGQQKDMIGLTIFSIKQKYPINSKKIKIKISLKKN